MHHAADLVETSQGIGRPRSAERRAAAGLSATESKGKIVTSQTPDKAAVVGAGLIGASWSGLFAAHGIDVRVFDVKPEQGALLFDFIESIRGDLMEIRGDRSASFGTIEFSTDLAETVSDAGFVMECVPEDLDLKHAVFSDLEPNLAHDAVLATSSSGLMLSELQAGLSDPGPLVLAHPFNPPHLIPLVELQVNENTRDGVYDSARAFLERCGKRTVNVRKEIPGHIANRLQAALWREAIHLVDTGVASVEDVDRAVTFGPGLRWAIMGPHMLFELGSATGGITGYARHFRESYHRWWNGMGQPRLTDETIAKLQAGVSDEAAGRDGDELRATRDRKLVATLKALRRAEA